MFDVAPCAGFLFVQALDHLFTRRYLRPVKQALCSQQSLLGLLHRPLHYDSIAKHFKRCDQRSRPVIEESDAQLETVINIEIAVETVAFRLKRRTAKSRMHKLKFPEI